MPTMRIRIPVIGNKVYSEILLRMNFRKLYLNELVEEFMPPKTQSVLSRQLKVLREEGYVIKHEGTYVRNKIYYSVNWNKIIDDFLDYASEKILSESDYDKEQLNELKNNSFRERCRGNFYVKEMFAYAFERISKSSTDVSELGIAEIFDYILLDDWLHLLSDDSDKSKLQSDREYGSFVYIGRILRFKPKKSVRLEIRKKLPTHFKSLIGDKTREASVFHSRLAERH